MTNTLILNSDMLPLSIVPLSTISWMDSITMEWLNRADVIAEYEDWTVRSPSVEMQVPSIMRLRDYVKITRIIKFSRYNVYLRDGFKCAYCNADFESKPYDLTIDHVIPRTMGGTTIWENVVACCYECNTEKAHHTNMKPKRPPYHPTYWEMVERRKKYPVAIPHKEWANYLDWDPKLIVLKH